MKAMASRTLLMFLLGWAGAAQLSTTNLQLHLELRTNGFDFAVDGIADFGAFFIYQASDLEALSG